MYYIGLPVKCQRELVIKQPSLFYFWSQGKAFNISQWNARFAGRFLQILYQIHEVLSYSKFAKKVFINVDLNYDLLFCINVANIFSLCFGIQVNIVFSMWCGLNWWFLSLLGNLLLKYNMHTEKCRNHKCVVQWIWQMKLECQLPHEGISHY